MNEHLYYQVFHPFVYISGFTLKVRSYTSDFEIALHKLMEHQFGKKQGGVHVSCLFHLKQAWRKCLIKNCKFSSHKIVDVMAMGGLDTLTI